MGMIGRPRKLNDVQVAHIRKLYAQGEKQIVLAAMFNVAESTIQRHVVGARPAGRYLNPAEVKQKLDIGASKEAIARHYGVTPRAIRHIAAKLARAA